MQHHVHTYTEGREGAELSEGERERERERAFKFRKVRVRITVCWEVMLV